MEKIKKHRLLIILFGISLIVIGIVLFFVLKPDNKNTYNLYDYSDNTVELPDTETYKNDKLSSKHCLNDICISNVVFYYNNNEGRVEYTITNNSRENKSGYLKMVFGDQTITVVYDLSPKKVVNSRSQYSGIEIKDKSDYKLRKLTKEELSRIKK